MPHNTRSSCSYLCTVDLHAPDWYACRFEGTQLFQKTVFVVVAVFLLNDPILQVIKLNLQ